MRRGVRRGGSIVRGETAAARAVVDVDAADRELLDGIGRAFEAVRRRAGDALACRAGCDRCCHGPFPITRLDRRRLQRGMTRLAGENPERAGAIRRRARHAIARLADGYPGDPRTGEPGTDVATLDRFFESHAELPCPVLDPASGRCELYDARPVACRIYGPPARFHDRDAPACELCFRGVPSERVEACRLEPDPQDRERAILLALGATDGAEWETLIAWAVADEGRR